MERMIFGYVTLLLGAIAALAVLAERRRRSLEVSRCPQCGATNEAVEF
jgi:hypothetical protein